MCFSVAVQSVEERQCGSESSVSSACGSVAVQYVVCGSVEV